MDIKNSDEEFLLEALALAESAVQKGNEPFGAVLVKDNQIVFTEYCERIEPPVRKNEPVNADNSATECGQGNHINNLANNRDLLY
ncbi:hypothetical protein ACWODM_16025, partial [Enterococcus olivae]